MGAMEGLILIKMERRWLIRIDFFFWLGKMKVDSKVGLF